MAFKRPSGVNIISNTCIATCDWRRLTRLARVKEWVGKLAELRFCRDFAHSTLERVDGILVVYRFGGVRQDTIFLLIFTRSFCSDGSYIDLRVASF